MDKRVVIEKILDRLGEDLEVLYKAARASHEEATHESSKAENKYDTRGLEASYLAAGQARQMAETEQTIADIRKMSHANFKPGSAVNLGALVGVDSKEGLKFYFVGTRGGGVEVEVGGKEIIVLTPQAPLGQLLMGKSVGDKFKREPGSKAVEYQVRSVE